MNEHVIRVTLKMLCVILADQTVILDHIADQKDGETADLYRQAAEQQRRIVDSILPILDED